MAALDISTVPIEKKQLFVPSLEEVAEVLRNGLGVNFGSSSVEVVDCPDLTKDPFYLALPGLSGSPQLFDIGGVPYLVPLAKKEKLYDLVETCKIAKIEPTFAIGAGAGPWPHLGVNCEGIFNLSIVDGKVDQQSKIASVSPIGAAKQTAACKLENLPSDETKCALLANIFVSQGKPGKVLKVSCAERIGKDDFVTSIRKCLQSKYKEKPVGLGGTFLLETGNAKQHVMPDFSKTPLESDDNVNDWLYFFDMKAPLINVGTMISHDPGLDLRVQHFHSFSRHGQGGHYHIDTTPEIARYTGYFTIAESIVRVDAPTETHAIGRD